MQIAGETVRGTFQILLGNVISALASALALVIVARLLGPSDYGLFSLAIVVSGLMQLFTGWGTTVGLSRQIAHNLAAGEVQKARSLTTIGFEYVFLTSGVVAAIGYALAPLIASGVMGRPILGLEIKYVMLMVFGNSVLNAGISAANGWGVMGLGAAADIVQGAAAVSLAPVLVLAGYGADGAVIGYSLSFLLAGLTAVALVIFFKSQIVRATTREFLDGVRQILRYGGPAYAGSSLNLFSNYFAIVILAAVLGNGSIGEFQAASNITFAVSVVTLSSSPALLPAFARLNRLGADAMVAFKLAVTYVAYLVVPIIFFLALAAQQLFSILYGAQYSGGTNYLVYLSLAYLPVVVGYATLQPFLNGIGQPMKTLYMLTVDAGVLIVLAPVLGIYFGLGAWGIILAILLSNIASVASGLFLVNRIFGEGVDYYPAAKILVSAAAAYLFSRLLPTTGSEPLELAVELFAFWGIYLTFIPLSGAVGTDDFRRMRTLSVKLPVFGLLARPFLRYETALSRLSLRLAREQGQRAKRHNVQPQAEETEEGPSSRCLAAGQT